jgi:hypothetical protein
VLDNQWAPGLIRSRPINMLVGTAIIAVALVFRVCMVDYAHSLIETLGSETLGKNGSLTCPTHVCTHAASCESHTRRRGHLVLHHHHHLHHPCPQ